MKKIILVSLVLILAYFGIRQLSQPERASAPPSVSQSQTPVTQAPNEVPAPSESAAPKTATLPIQDHVQKLIQEQNWYEALEKVQEHLQKNPQDTWALEMGGMLLLSKMEKPEEALPYFQKYLEVDPKSEFVIRRIEEIGDRTEQVQKSFDILKAIDEKAPGNGALELALADGYSNQGNTQKAREYYKKSAQAPDQQSSALRRLGRLDSDAGNFKAAQENFRASMSTIEKGRDDLLKAGQDTKYLDQTLNYIRLDLIETLIKAKDYETARRELEAATEFFPPGHPPLKKLQDQLES